MCAVNNDTHIGANEMKQPGLTHDERCAGKRADYLVYYRDSKGKLFYQAVYASNMADADAWLKAAVRNATIVRTLVRRPHAEI
jgi:hypothetical protein